MKLRGRKAGNYRGDSISCSAGGRCGEKKPLVLVLCSVRLLSHLVSATGRRVWGFY